MPEMNARLVEIYNDVCQLLLAADLDTQAIITSLTEKAVDLAGADFGAYFRNVPVGDTDVWELYAIHGAPSETFTRLGKPRITKLFHPTFTGEGVVHVADVLADPRYGSMGGMPKGHLPVRSYLALPVASSRGKTQGAMLFGHTLPGQFTERMVTILKSIATLAAVALDNAFRFEELEREAEYRKLLLAELNHRVKNTLATVQGVINATVRSSSDPNAFADSVTNRIASIAGTHNLLTDSNWTGADICDIVKGQVEHYDIDGTSRVSVRGPRLKLQSAAVTAIGMLINELATNAVKYGSLSVPEGIVRVTWRTKAGGEAQLQLLWREVGGPPITEPVITGFGTRLLRSVSRQLGGTMITEYRPAGLCCCLDVPLAGVLSSGEPSPFLSPNAKPRDTAAA